MNFVFDSERAYPYSKFGTHNCVFVRFKNKIAIKEFVEGNKALTYLQITSKNKCVIHPFIQRYKYLLIKPEIIDMIYETDDLIELFNSNKELIKLLNEIVNILRSIKDCFDAIDSSVISDYSYKQRIVGYEIKDGKFRFNNTVISYLTVDELPIIHFFDGAYSFTAESLVCHESTDEEVIEFGGLTFKLSSIYSAFLDVQYKIDEIIKSHIFRSTMTKSAMH